MDQQIEGEQITKKNNNRIQVIISVIIITGIITTAVTYLFYSQKSNILQKQHQSQIASFQKQIFDYQNQNSELQQQIASLNKQMESKNKEIDNNLDSEASNKSQQTFISDKWQLYKNNKLKISFLFPEELGIIEEKDESDHIILTASSSLFLGADNGGESVGRGGYWGDEAKFINNEEYIKYYCKNKNNCTVDINKNDILYAKEIIDNFSEWGSEPHKTIFYLLHNSKSEYRGIIISNQRFAEKNISNIEDIFEKIIDSIKFVN